MHVCAIASLIAAPYHASVALDGVSKCNHLSTRGMANKDLQPLVRSCYGAVEHKLQQLGATGGLESVASFRLQLANNQRKRTDAQAALQMSQQQASYSQQWDEQVQQGHAQIAHAERTASHTSTVSSADQAHQLCSAQLILHQLPLFIQAAEQHRSQAVHVAAAYSEYAECLLASTSEEADEAKLCAAR